MAAAGGRAARRTPGTFAGSRPRSSRDCPPPHDHIAVHQACELAGGGAVDRLVELELQLVMTAGPEIPSHPGRERSGSIPKLDAVDARAVTVKARRAHRHAPCLQR